MQHNFISPQCFSVSKYQTRQIVIVGSSPVTFEFLHTQQCLKCEVVKSRFCRMAKWHSEYVHLCIILEGSYNFVQCNDKVKINDDTPRL